MRPTIGVIGLGFIGLPLSLSFCEKGYRVIGIDINEEKIIQLCRGETDVCEMYQGQSLQTLLKRHIATGAFVPTYHGAVAAWESSAYIVTVGIPIKSDGSLNEQPLLSAIADIGRVMKPRDLVLVRSTVVPGMMEKKIVPLLEQSSGMVAGTDFHVAYAAERVAEGRAMYEFQTLDLVLAGFTPRCAAVAAKLLGDLTSGTIHITSMRVAESVKVIENAQRDVNIALAQDIAVYAELQDIDVLELIRVANTHPRVNLLEPGIGVGGYCIPNAYHYLHAALPESKELPLFHLSRELNEAIPNRMVQRIAEKLHTIGKELEGSKVAVLGLGMKDYSNDLRYSPAITCVGLLLQQGADVRAFDPTVHVQYPYQVLNLADCLRDVDAVIVGAWQQDFECAELVDIIGEWKKPVVMVDFKHRLQSYLDTAALTPNSALVAVL